MPGWDARNGYMIRCPGTHRFTVITASIRKECRYNCLCSMTEWKLEIQVGFTEEFGSIDWERYSRIQEIRFWQPHWRFTRKEICDYLGLSSVTYAIQRHVMPLVKEGLIYLSIPEKPGSQKQLFYRKNRKQKSQTGLFVPRIW